MLFNELDLLELRLEYMDSVVDRFVITEASKTHAGNPKELLFEKNRERFSKWLPKIKYYVVNFPDVIDTPMGRDNYQRKMLMEGLQFCMPNDIILVSDLDEFPDKKIIERMRIGFSGVIGFVQWIFYFYINRLDLSRKWIGPAASDFGLMTQYNLDTDKLRDIVRGNRAGGYVEGGWHFSWLGGAEKIKYKMQNYAHHVEDAKFCDDKRIANTLITSNDLLREEVKHGIVALESEHFPDFIREKENKLRELGWLYELPERVV
jgi:beta-1,4-mannosyl-glycoprotein beta-1,4-N-acetylglucosaminyltransferase